MNDNILFAFLITLVAGLATGIGSAIAFFANKTNKKFLSYSLGFSAGVMIYVSFVDLFQQSLRELSSALGAHQGHLITVLAFFGGIFLIALIDKMVPSYENPHEIRDLEHMHDTLPKKNNGHKQKLMRMGMMTALTIGIHNFPEGIATFMAAMSDVQLGVAIAVAIAIHNIPEGIAVSVPIYYATGSRKKAFFYSFLSGIAEPVGAIVGYLILLPFMSPVVMGCLFAGVAGIMVYISLDELLPAAREYGEHHISIYGLISGMMIMAASLVIL